jgi:peptidoglycan/xylan/chitin deacetylase (PgdA/CDA1 family)
MEMRGGVQWLAALFARHDVKGTFYATGYNLLDGNRDRRTFVGDPTYDWASPEHGWNDEYWLTHRWFSDDPFGDFTSHPAWYFGDQTRMLVEAGHEVAPHTFGHLYVRGSNPVELEADLSEWLNTSRAQGAGAATTFAFPWRSSNSLTADFYEVLYEGGIRAVTRIYERDVRDLYTLFDVPAYPALAVMPDFLLGVSEADSAENEGGEVISGEQGLNVLGEAVRRRGTTSFWTHPEELAEGVTLAQNRESWEMVVAEAAAMRDTGFLWIARVDEIVEYQAGLRRVSTELVRPGLLGAGGWALEVHNASGRVLQGVTLTLPGEVRRATTLESTALIQFVRVTGKRGTEPERIELVSDQTVPTRQLVLSNLQTGDTLINIEWSPGQEPLE